MNKLNQNKHKTPKESQIEMRELVMPGDTNPRSTIFGGKIMSWMDMACAMAAERHANQPVVTAHISDIDFISPIKIGQHVLIRSSVNYVGRSSMVVGVRVDSENPYTGVVRKCTKAYLTFVALDDLGRPMEVPGLVPETEDEKRRFEEAKERVRMKKDLRKKFSQKNN